MVDDKIADDFDIPLVSLGQQPVEIGKGPELRVDIS